MEKTKVTLNASKNEDGSFTVNGTVCISQTITAETAGEMFGEETSKEFEVSVSPIIAE